LTAFHPQTDGETERVNQILGQYLKIFTLYNHDDWSLLLPQASLCYSGTIHSATKVSPFYANYGFHPRLIYELKPTLASEVPEGLRIADSLVGVHGICSANIAKASRVCAKAYNKSRTDAPLYCVGDKVMLSTKNIKTTRPIKKLNIKQSGPFTIMDLPELMLVD